jgi:hypothetical protein
MRREQPGPVRLHPGIEPYDHGLLDVGDGHQVYWETCGRPGGKPAVVLHYWRHAAWLEEDALLRGAERLVGIPGVLVHGRLDVSSPLDVPWRLARAWDGGELVIVDDEGHGGAGIADAVVSATGRFARAGRYP